MGVLIRDASLQHADAAGGPSHCPSAGPPLQVVMGDEEFEQLPSNVEIARGLQVLVSMKPPRDGEGFSVLRVQLTYVLYIL